MYLTLLRERCNSNKMSLLYFSLPGYVHKQNMKKMMDYHAVNCKKKKWKRCAIHLPGNSTLDLLSNLIKFRKRSWIELSVGSNLRPQLWFGIIWSVLGWYIRNITKGWWISCRVCLKAYHFHHPAGLSNCSIIIF